MMMITVFKNWVYSLETLFFAVGYRWISKETARASWKWLDGARPNTLYSIVKAITDVNIEKE